MAKSGIKKKTRNCLINLLNKWILSILIWRITAKIKQSIKDFVKDKKQRCFIEYIRHYFYLFFYNTLPIETPI